MNHEKNIIPAVGLCLTVILIHMTSPCGCILRPADDSDSNNLEKSRPENFMATHPFQHKLRPPPQQLIPGASNSFQDPAAEEVPTATEQVVRISHEQNHMWKLTMGNRNTTSRHHYGRQHAVQRPIVEPLTDAIEPSSSSSPATVQAPLKSEDSYHRSDVSDSEDIDTTEQNSLDSLVGQEMQNSIKKEKGNRKKQKKKAVPKVGCRSCMLNAELESNLPAQVIRQMRLELIKEEILKKLGLTEPPNATHLPKESIPLPVAQGSTLPRRRHPHSGRQAINDDEDDAEDYYGKTEQVIIFPEDAIPRCIPHMTGPASCFTFKMPQENPVEQISSAELWVYKVAHGTNGTLWVDEVSPSARTEGSDYVTVRNIDMKRNVMTREGWVKFNVSQMVPRWMRNQGIDPIVQIGCSGCESYSNEDSYGTDLVSTSGEQRPFIVINFKSVPHKKRSRRSLTCSPTLSECCRESFVVSFREIGWDSWIIGPSSYNAYYCKGSCISMNGFVHATKKHTTVMQEYIRTFGITNRTAEIVPCCTASKMSPISVIYRDPNNLNNTLKKEILPDMVVDSCGCK